MSDLELCDAVLNDLIRGIELIEGRCPCYNLEVEEDAIDGAELLLQVSVFLEPLLPKNIEQILLGKFSIFYQE